MSKRESLIYIFTAHLPKASTFSILSFPTDNPGSHQCEDWQPPNGGYGWVIVTVAFMLYLEFTSYSQLGILMLELQNHFNATKTQISWLNACQGLTGRFLGKSLLLTFLDLPVLQALAKKHHMSIKHSPCYAT